MVMMVDNWLDVEYVCVMGKSFESRVLVVVEFGDHQAEIVQPYEMAIMVENWLVVDSVMGKIFESWDLVAMEIGEG